MSYADVARALDVDEETVRARLRKLEAEGILKGWEIVVNPHLLGRDMTRFECPRPEPAAYEKVMAALRAFDGAYLIFEYHTGGPVLVFFAPTGPARERQLRLLTAIAGEPRSLSTMACPVPPLEMEALDWRIVAALRRDPRKPYAELAAEVGASERTLRRRIERLTEGQAVFLSGIIDMSRITGVVAVHLTAHIAEPSHRRDIDAVLQGLPNRMFFAQMPDRSRVSVMARGLGELGELRARIAALPGVGQVEADFALSRMSVLTWMDEEVARRAAEG